MTEDHGDLQPASMMAERIVACVDRDLAFIPKLMGESLHLLTCHFVKLIEHALAKEGMGYGDHPLLRPFVELHSRDLTDLVLDAIGLRHQFGVQTLELMAGDPLCLLRVDLWDSLSASIADAERPFLHQSDGLAALLANMRDAKITTTKAADA